MGEPIKESENRALIEHFTRNQEVQLISTDGLQVLAVPGNRQVLSLEKFRAETALAPLRCKGISEHTTLASFIAHANRFKDAGTVLFVDVSDKDAPAMLAVYNYNPKPGEPRFGDHRARYAFPLSEEWRAWGEAFDSEGLGQLAFAELLEDRMRDILDPANATQAGKEQAAELGLALATPSTMLSLSRGLAVRVNQGVKQVVKLGSGEGQIAFEESHDASDSDGKPVRVPGGFVLAIPAFEGGEAFQVLVRLRYRVSGGRVLWMLVPHRLNKVFDVATRESAEVARAGTDLPLFFGRPEL
jgi:uncharacterized protein YfdQ (DUF2303 family)